LGLTPVRGEDEPKVEAPQTGAEKAAPAPAMDDDNSGYTIEKKRRQNLQV